MPTEFKGEEYKFPDEIQSTAALAAADTDPIEVEVEDDTPEEDRNRKPSPTPPEEPTEDELSSYDEKVQARIKKFTKGYHDERRAKEQALREREAAENFARQVTEENRQLQARLQANSSAFAEKSKTAAEMRVAAAQKKYKEAYEAGDSEALTKAQTELSEATWDLKAAQSAVKKVERASQPLQQQQNVVQPAQQVNTPRLSDRDSRWLETNTWFGPDEEMTASALGLHQKLTREKGAAYIGSEDYYQTIDTVMRRRFPEYFGSKADSDEPPQETSAPAEESPRRAAKPANVVAPATRSTPPNRIRLKASEVSIAKRLGVPLEEYARRVAQLKKEAR